MNVDVRGCLLAGMSLCLAACGGEVGGLAALPSSQTGATGVGGAPPVPRPVAGNAVGDQGNPAGSDLGAAPAGPGMPLVADNGAGSVAGSGALPPRQLPIGGSESQGAGGAMPSPLVQPDPVELPRDPGRVTLHRLNRAEYNNTVRDLFRGLDLSPADSFPADGMSYGFSNIASAMSVDSVLFELYDRAADTVLSAAFASPDRDSWMPCSNPDAFCTRQILDSVGERAWRRPLQTVEVDRLAAVVAEGESTGLDWEGSLKQGLKAALISPHFLFRVELDEEPTDLTPHGLNGFELASRLSYFLWSSMPDDELFELARSGELLDPTVGIQQVERMLKDPRAGSLAENFAAQWFRTREIDSGLSKDEELYPDFDDELRQSMRTELDRVLERIFEEGLSFRELLLGKETFVDQRLAQLYGVPAPQGEGFALVSLEGTPRQGILTTAGLQALLSYPEKTSPVQRGMWVLEHLLCIEPPPPPEGIEIPEIEPDPEATTREELEQHRSNPTCASCHQLMDPIGLAFENYDAMGAFRETEDGIEIDARGHLPDGATFNNALEMLPLLADHPNFGRCVTQKALTYALGRGLNPSDRVFVDEVADAVAAGSMSLEDLAKSIVTNDIFTMRRGEKEEEEL